MDKPETYKFHGSFSDREKAKKREKEIKGFTREKKVLGKKRYFVFTKE